MSSAVFSTSAALSRPFVFDAEPAPDVCPDLFSAGRPPQPARPAETGYLASADPRLSSITPASRLDVRPAPDMASSGIAALDALTGGLPRGCLTEICGPASSGRTTLLLAALAAATARGEFCVVVDASDALDPHSVAAAGVKLDRLLWVRCGENSPPKSRAETSPAAFKSGQAGARQSEHCLEQLLRATDLLLDSGGFGLIVLDICDVTPQAARRIPLTTWFRFRRAVEHKPTVLLAFEQHPIAGSCSSLLLKLGSQNNPEGAMKWKHSESSRVAAAWDSPARQCRVADEKTSEPRRACPELVEGDGTAFAEGNGTTHDVHDDSQIAKPAHTHLLTGLGITVELIRFRLEPKPVRSASVAFASKTAWAG